MTLRSPKNTAQLYKLHDNKFFGSERAYSIFYNKTLVSNLIETLSATEDLTYKDLCFQKKNLEMDSFLANQPCI